MLMNKQHNSFSDDKNGMQGLNKVTQAACMRDEVQEAVILHAIL